MNTWEAKQYRKQLRIQAWTGKAPGHIYTPAVGGLILPLNEAIERMASRLHAVFFGDDRRAE